MKDHDERTSELQSLLRGEISALETYEKAIGEVGNEPGVEDLRRIAAQHSAAVQALRRQIVLEGEAPADGSGAWGAFARAVQNTANVFGDKSALKALKEGEEHGLKEYRDAAEDENTPAALRGVIRDELLPRQQEHIRTLDRLMERR